MPHSEAQRHAMAWQNYGNALPFSSDGFWQEVDPITFPLIAPNFLLVPSHLGTSILRLKHYSSHTKCYCVGPDNMERGKYWCYFRWSSSWTDTLCELGLAISSREDFISANASSCNHTIIRSRLYSWLPFSQTTYGISAFKIQAQPQETLLFGTIGSLPRWHGIFDELKAGCHSFCSGNTR